MNGIELIAEERLRQVSQEGWTKYHDDRHVYHELAHAAICYAKPGIRAQTPANPPWPWAPEWWKPSEDRIRNLVKAGALIAAEIDRLQRNHTP